MPAFKLQPALVLPWLNSCDLTDDEQEHEAREMSPHKLSYDIQNTRNWIFPACHEQHPQPGSQNPTPQAQTFSPEHRNIHKAQPKICVKELHSFHGQILVIPVFHTKF